MALWDACESAQRPGSLDAAIDPESDSRPQNTVPIFPKVRKLVESHGEVILTEKGKPRYRLTLYTPDSAAKPSPVDYWARLNSYQPRAMTKAQSRALHDENRGER